MQLLPCASYHHGEGGAVLTDNLLLKKLILSFRDWGRDCWCDPGCDDTCKKRFGWQLGSLPVGYDHKYIPSHIGYNLKATDMQAAVGVEQLRKLPRFIEKRKENFMLLCEGLCRYDKYFMLPRTTSKSEPSWFGFPLLVRADAPFKREKVIRYLEENKIATRMLFGGNLIKQPAYKSISHRKFHNLSNTDHVMDMLFWIGVYPGLENDKIEYMIRIINAFIVANEV